jgi:hypothetical protein
MKYKVRIYSREGGKRGRNKFIAGKMADWKKEIS